MLEAIWKEVPISANITSKSPSDLNCGQMRSAPAGLESYGMLRLVPKLHSVFIREIRVCTGYLLQRQVMGMIERKASGEYDKVESNR